MRLTRNQFFDLTIDFLTLHFTKYIITNHLVLNADKKLAQTYYLKDTESLIITANSFRVAINTTSFVVYEVSWAIRHNLGPQYICLPKTSEEMR